MRSHLVGFFLSGLLLVMPAYADNPVPNVQFQEVLIKTSLMTFNDANLTGNYTVMHAKMAKPFREQLTPDKMKQAFKSFAAQAVEMRGILLKPPVATTASAIDKRGALVLRGYFETAPSRVIYEIDFLPSEGEWKPIMLHVRVKAAGEG